MTPRLSENLEKFTAGFARATIEKWEDIPPILRDLRPDLTVIDCYELEERFENLCLPYTRRLAVIDDLHNRRHNCHILIAGSLTATEDEYRPLVPPSAMLLTGGEYLLISSEFMKRRKETVSTPFESCLISFGGADPAHATIYTVKSIIASEYLKKFSYTIVTGAVNPDHAAIEDLLAASNVRYRLLKYSNRMPWLMQTHDFAIGACGGMGSERLSVGLPSNNVIIADNQNSMRILCARHEIGPLFEVKDLKDIRRLEQGIKTLETNAEAIMKNGQQLIKGCGFDNIAAVFDKEIKG